MSTSTRDCIVTVGYNPGEALHVMNLSNAEDRLLRRLRQLKDAIVTIVVREGEPMLLETTGKLEILGETHTR